MVLVSGKLVDKEAKLGFRRPLGNKERLMPMLHQLHVGSLADVVIDKGVEIAHSCCHISKRVVIICAGNPALIIPFCNHLGGFELAIKGLFVKEPVLVG